MDEVDESKKRAVEILAEKIETANDYYWRRNNSQISDEEYDKLVEELRKMAPNHPLLNKIGDGPDEVVFGKKIHHKIPMLSLAKAYSFEDVLKWVKKVSRSKDEVFCVEPKYDGLSCEMCNGKMVTRGDGYVGSECTHIAKYVQMNAHPLFAKLLTSSIPSYHEIVIRKAAFKLLRSKFPELAQYKTPRNMAAGLVNTRPEVLDKLFQGKDIKEILWLDPHDGDPAFMPAYNQFTPKNFERWVNAIKSKCPSPIDGVVFKLGDLDYRASLGATEHHPNGAIAFKFQDAEYSTIVRRIVWDVGAQAVTPVVQFDPVEIEDPSSGTTVTVSQATAHNGKFIQNNHIVPGTRITIVRRGGVIPKVVAVEKIDSIEATIPTQCPSCGEDLVWQGPELVCTSDNCTGRITTKIVKGLDFLGLKGLGPKWIEKTINDFYVEDIIDWCTEACDEKTLRAKQYPEYIIRIMTSELTRIMNEGVTDEDIFASLCIPEASTSFAKLIRPHVTGFEDLCDPARYNEFKTLSNVNSTALKNAVFWMDANKDRYMTYWNMFVHKRSVDMDNRKKFCFTGALPMSRMEVSGYVMQHGGAVTENINQADYLVTDNPMSNSSKMNKAKKRGIPVINYETLKQMLERK